MLGLLSPLPTLRSLLVLFFHGTESEALILIVVVFLSTTSGIDFFSSVEPHYGPFFFLLLSTCGNSKHQFLALCRFKYSSSLQNLKNPPFSHGVLASFVSRVSLTLYDLGSMKGEGMTKRSMESLMRKKLSDITNLQPQPKLPGIQETLLENFSANKDCIEQLLKIPSESVCGSSKSQAATERLRVP